jgi:hypothetical protein
MKPDDSNPTGLFANQVVQYSVPHYQRRQAWSAEKHFEPLWADIEGKANDWFNATEPKSHYLGAVVLAKRPKKGVRGIDRCLVIDGQQRLSTLQYLLKALKLLSDESEYEDGSLSIQQELYNTNETMMDRAEIQKYKLWPTFRDRDAHCRVMQSESVIALKQAFAENFTKAGQLYANQDHPRPLATTWFFYNRISGWIDEIADEGERVRGLEAVRKAVTKSLQLIILWLEPKDDPQVIFECLNGRGEPLRPTDLIKNFIFMTGEAEAAEQSEEMTEESSLFKSWSKLDEPMWMGDVARGRITHTLLEWLIYYVLQVETGEDLDNSQMYETYQTWAAPRSGTPVSSRQQVDILLSYATLLQDFVSANPLTPIGKFGQIVKGLDVTVVSAVALAVAKNCDVESQEDIFRAIESYLVRRDVCGLPKKAYNVIFLALLNQLKTKGFALDVLTSYLSSLQGDSSLWPDDVVYAHSIKTRAIYGGGSSLNLCRLMLAAVAAQIGGGHASELQWRLDWGKLHVEHLMPQSWYEHWPLPNSSMATEEQAKISLHRSDDDSEEGKQFAFIRRREQLKNTLGNLTVLNEAINTEIKNYAWATKQTAIRAATQLRMNYDIVSEPAWNEDKIVARSQSLADILLHLWPKNN